MEVLEEFDVTAALPEGRVALEASAGTGKTWTIAALVVRYVAEGVVDVDQLLVVTFTRAATAELRDRIRTRLVSTLAVLDGHPDPDDDPVAALLCDASPDEVTRRRDRVAAAIAGFDAATITTIHGFCHQVLATAGHVGDLDAHGALVDNVDDIVRAATRDLLVDHFADADPDVQAGRPRVSAAEKVADVVLREPTADLRPEVDDPDADPGARALARLGHEVRAEVDRRKRTAGVLTFDDLLTRLAGSLDDDAVRPALLDALRSRYRLALIDEFQDTDPVQWAILGQVFADRTLVLIGDPKQAIYRFRGADVHAYLDATHAPGTRRATLRTNHRSDGRLVEACNRLFDGTAFGSDAIPHREVRARHADDRLTFAADADATPSLLVRAVQRGMTADVSRALIARDLAAEITRLLAARPTLPGDRPLRPGDCAVLVRSNVQAADVKQALAAVGIHAVINGVGSVLDTPAAGDWIRLLEALERPSSPGRVRALALTPLVGATPAEVAEADDDAEAARHDQAHRWSRVVADHGIATLVRTVQRETGMVPRLLSQDGGERYLTDFEHLAELLHAMAASERLGPAALLGWLVDQQQRVDELPEDQRARRLESDARAVQVLTVHRAKGLQFPVVFCPYVMSTGVSPRVPIVHRDGSGRTVVDVGSPAEQDAKGAARAEDLGEQLRLLYVAATRAEHRLVLWWWPLSARRRQPGYCESATSKVLFCPENPDGPRVRADLDAPKLDLKALPAALDTAVGRLGDGAAWAMVPDDPQPVDWTDDDTGDVDPRRRVFTGDVDRAWTRASYTALTRPVPRRTVEGAPDTVPARQDETDLEAVPPAPDELVDHRALPLGDQPAGAAFGTVVHAVVEHVDLAADDLAEALAEQVTHQARRGGLDLPDPVGLASGLTAALRTPLGPAFGEVALAGLDRRDRLDELEFELPLAQGDTHVTLAAVGELLAQHLPPGDPFVDYPPRLADRDLARRVRGFLTGSIDLVLRRPAGDGHVFHVVDHKTNRLFASDDVGSTWHYRPAALADAMQHSHYPLQAVLYQVALHRYLRWRLPHYDPDTHLGHTAYLFLRGMVGPDAPRVDGTPCGVMAWRPPTALVTDLSDLLSAGRERAA